MATRTTGAEYKRFYSDPNAWPADSETWNEDTILKVNGVELEDYDVERFADTDRIIIVSGIVLSDRWDSDQAPSLESYFKRWKKAQDTVILTVQVSKELQAAVEKAIAEVGGKLVK